MYVDICGKYIIYIYACVFVYAYVYIIIINYIYTLICVCVGGAGEPLLVQKLTRKLSMLRVVKHCLASYAEGPSF